MATSVQSFLQLLDSPEVRLVLPVQLLELGFEDVGTLEEPRQLFSIIHPHT
jgi:hypothetical protein